MVNCLARIIDLLPRKFLIHHLPVHIDGEDSIARSRTLGSVAYDRSLYFVFAQRRIYGTTYIVQAFMELIYRHIATIIPPRLWVRNSPKHS